MIEYEESPLYRIMHPRSVAFWGASSNPMGMGSVQMSSLLALGFEGPVYPVHPKEREIQGLKAYASIADVPGPVDLAVLVIPTRIVPDILEQCGKAGVKGAIVTTAGFGEKGEEGKAAQQRMVEISEKYDLKLLGPNCLGAVNTAENLNTTFLQYVAPPGFIGMASQSGSFVTQMFSYLNGFGLGFSQAISVGNEAAIDLTDCIEYLGQCPETKVIALYVETIRRGAEFIKVAKEVSRIKPIVAYYVGGSEAGRNAALSHTGALAGPDELYDGIFNQCGIIRSESIAELFDICWLLGAQPLPKGDKIALLTHSGGPGASAADAADRRGLTLAQFSEKTKERLLELVPHTASIANPVDLTFDRKPQDYVETLPGILLEDHGVDSLFIYLMSPPPRIVKNFMAMFDDPEQAKAMAKQFLKSQCKSLAALPSKYGKPVVGGTFSPMSDPFMQQLQERGVVVLPSPERAVTALSAQARYAKFKEEMGEESGE